MFGAPPQNPHTFFRIEQFKHPHPRYPKTALLTFRVHWYGCLGHRPMTQPISFGHSAVQKPPSSVSKNTFAGLCSTEVLVFGVPPQNPNKFFSALCSSNTPMREVCKNSFAGLWGTVVLLFGASPHNPNKIILALRSSNTPIIGMCVRGAVYVCVGV